VTPTDQILAGLRAAFLRGRGVPGGEGTVELLGKCGRRWYALAGFGPPAPITDPELGVRYQDGPDIFVGSGPASWRWVSETGASGPFCGRRRGEFPRALVRAAGLRCERLPPQLTPGLAYPAWESCQVDLQRPPVVEVSGRRIFCENARDVVRALVARGGPRPDGVFRVAGYAWFCRVQGPAKDTAAGRPLVLTRCNLGPRQIVIAARGPGFRV
jgi:hypothetical protein